MVGAHDESMKCCHSTKVLGREDLEIKTALLKTRVKSNLITMITENENSFTVIYNRYIINKLCLMKPKPY